MLKTFKGEALLGTKYERLMPFGEVEGKAFEVIHGDYVNLEFSFNSSIEPIHS